MGELDYKLIDFFQIEKHVDSTISDLRRVQNAGKHPKKVCSAAMYGANMLGAQKNIISSARAEVDRLEQENAELREALRRIRNWNELGLTERIDIGADGVRDYYRNVADLALNK